MLLLLEVSKALVDLNEFEQLLSNETVFVSVMLANNEPGNVQPVKEIVEICRRYNPDIVSCSFRCISMRGQDSF